MRPHYITHWRPLRNLKQHPSWLPRRGAFSAGGAGGGSLDERGVTGAGVAAVVAGDQHDLGGARGGESKILWSRCCVCVHLEQSFQYCQADRMKVLKSLVFQQI